MKIERKITFVVAGIEFDNLKTAQFFQRAIRLHKLEQESPGTCAAFLIDHWNSLIFGGKKPLGFTTQQVVALVQNLQLPKAHHIQKKFTTLSEVLELKKKNVQVLAGDPLNFGPAPGEQEEIEFPTIPGVYGRDDMLG